MSGQKRPSFKGATLSLDLLPEASPLTIYCSTTESVDKEESESDKMIRARLNELKKSHFAGASTSSSSEALAARLARLRDEENNVYNTESQSHDVLRPRAVKSEVVEVDELMAQMAAECAIDTKINLDNHESKKGHDDDAIALRLEALRKERLGLEAEGVIEKRKEKRKKDVESMDDDEDNSDEELSSVLSDSDSSLSSEEDERADRLIEQILAEQRLEERQQQDG